MYATLVWNDIRNHFMTFRFGAFLLITFVLISASVWILGEDYNRRLDTYNTLSERTRNQLSEVLVPAHIQPTVFKAPSKLGIFAQGEEKRLGNAVKIKRWSVPSEAEDRLTDNQLMSAFIPFDLLTVFTLITSLFGILISYDAVSGDREKGILKLVCSYNLGRGVLFSAKFVAGVVILAIPLSISYIGALLILQFVHRITFDLPQWLAVALMLPATIIYGAVFVSIGLLSSSVFRRSSISLVFALLIWTISVLLIPGTAVMVSSLIVGSPSPTELQRLEAETQQEAVAGRAEFRKSHPRPAGYQMGTAVGYSEEVQVFECTLPDIGEMDFSRNNLNPELWRWSLDVFRLVESLWQQRAETLDNLNRRHTESKKQQKRLADLLTAASPASQLRSVFTSCADTDYQAQLRFLEHVRRYRSELLDGFRRKGYFGENAISFISQRSPDDLTPEKLEARWNYYRSQIKAPDDFVRVLSADTWNPLPSDILPHFADIKAEPRFEDTILPVALMIFISALFFAAGFVMFVRYDVR